MGMAGPKVELSRNTPTRTDGNRVNGSTRQGSRVVKNLLVTTASQVLGTGLNVLIGIVVARYLGVQQYGRYAYILAFVGVFQLMASVGLDQILIREIAIRTHQAPRLVGLAKTLMWPLSLLTFAAIAGVIHLAGAPWEIRLATYVAAVGVIAMMHAICFGAVFRALEEMEVNAAGFVAHKLVLLGLVLAGVWGGYGLLGMCVAFTLANVFLWAYYRVVLVSRHFRPRWHFSLTAWRSLLAEAFPLGVAAILRRSSWQVAIVLLAAFGKTAAAGYFSAAYKIVEALNLIPLTLAQVIFPMLARTARSRADAAFDELFVLARKALLFVSVPLTLTLAIGADRIIGAAYGPAFEAASTVLVITGLALLPLFCTSLYPFVFTAIGRQRQYTIAVSVALAANILVDLTLIPRLAHVGASIGTLTGELALFAVGSYFLRSLNHWRPWVASAWRSLLASSLLGMLLWTMREASLPVFVVATGVGWAIYVGLLIELGAILPSEITQVTGEIRRWLGTITGRRAANTRGDRLGGEIAGTGVCRGEGGRSGI